MTALEWLIDEILSWKNGTSNLSAPEIAKQAKELEKQQIIEAYETGYSDSDNTFALNKNYYNETFKK